MKKYLYLFVVLFLFFMFSPAYAGTYLFGYTPGGALGGGVRFDLGPSVVTDLSLTAASGDSGSTYSLYGDIFRGNWGIGVLAKKPAVNSDIAFEFSLQYAVEQTINDSINVGVLLMLVNYDTTDGADPNMMFLPTISPYIVLAL
jgi:hypothetical protein